jgi:haloalkane dehalogenase
LDNGRWLAPDLVGMGDSEKISEPKSHTSTENSRDLDAFDEDLALKKYICILLILLEWQA